MAEIDDLRRDVEALRRELAGAKQALGAFARGEVDAVSQGASAPPVLLEEAQRELRRSRALLRAVFDVSLDALLLVDERGVCVDASRAACELLGHAHEALVGRDISAAASVENDPVPQLAELLKAGTAPGVVHLARPGGPRRVLESNVVENVTAGLRLLALRDVTDRVAKEEALRRGEARFRAMIEKSQDGISLLTAEGRALYQSPAVERMIGYGIDESAAMAWRDYLDEDQVPNVQRALEALLTGGPLATAFVEFRIRHRDPGQYRWLELSATNLLHDPDVGALITNFRDITARKVLEQERDGFFRLSLDLLCIIGMDGRFKRLNPAWSTTLGWSLEELVSCPPLEFVHPDDRAATEREGAKLAAGAGTLRFENRYRCKDGSYRRLRWAAMPAVESGLIYATAHDVTEERAAAERQRLLFEASPVPKYVLDAQSLRMIDANDAALALYGYTRDEFLALSIADIVIEPQHGDLSAALGQITRERRIRVVGRRHRTKSGAVRDVEVTGSYLDLGDRPAIVSVVVDVTARLAMEAALRASERRYRRIVDNASEGIWMYDAWGVTTFVNPAMAAMLDCTVEEAIGKPIFAFIEDGEMREAARQRLGRRTAERAEVRLRRRDGSDIWVAMRTDPLMDDAGNFESALALVTDITERIRSQAELRRSEEQRRQAQKMEAVGSLAGGIAHDFNNLLSVVVTYASLILEDLPPADPMRVDIEEIHRAGLRAAELTRQLLAFGRKQIMQPVVVDVNLVVLGVEKMLRRVLGEDIEVALLTSADAGKVFADRGQLEQVLVNLVVNARDAMPAGGRITIETSNAVLDEAYAATHAGVTAGEYVLVAVTDTGVGMDHATQQRVFEPFFTTKEAGKGTGLGLSTVYGIVQQSGGHIWVYSEPGHGSTFKIYLPRTERSLEPVAASAAQHSSVRGIETILLVEDEAPVRNVLCAVLRRNGYNVLEAQNGGEAFLVCEQFPATIHLLLTDVVMPRMSGRQLAERLALLRPEMKVLYVSGYTEDTVVHHGVFDAGVEFLPKPIQPEALLKKVRQVLDSAPRSGVPTPK